MTPVQIRPARPDDEAVITDIVQRAYGVYVERIGRRPAPMDDDYGSRIAAGSTFVAQDEAVIGLVVLVLEPETLLIENVAVDRSHQRRGIGAMLMRFAECFAREHRRDVVRLYTNVAMTENLAIYAHLGYQEVQRQAQRGFQRVYMAKRVAPGFIVPGH